MEPIVEAVFIPRKHPCPMMRCAVTMPTAPWPCGPRAGQITIDGLCEALRLMTEGTHDSEEHEKPDDHGHPAGHLAKPGADHGEYQYDAGEDPHGCTPDM